MNIDINRFRVYLKEEINDRIAPFKKPLFVSECDTFFHNLAADNPPVDEENLAAARCFRERRRWNIATYRKTFFFIVYRHHIFRIDIVINADNRIETVSVPRRCKENFAVINQSEFDIFIGERNLWQKIDNHAAFRPVAFHKFQSGGCIVKQVRDDNGGSVRTSRLLVDDRLSAMKHKPCSGFGILCFGNQFTSGYSGNGSKRLTTEAEGFNRFKVFDRGNFAGCMAQKGCQNLFSCNSTSVIGYSNIGLPTVFYFNHNGWGSGI